MTRTLILVLSILCSACGDGKGDVFGEPLSKTGEEAPVLESKVEPKKLLIFGGTAGIGLETTRLALARGHIVTSIARRPERMTIEHENLRNLKGDITKGDTFAVVLATQDIVISTIGIGPGRDPVSVYSDGINNVLSAMKQSTVSRVVTVTGIGAGDSKGHGGFFYDRILNPLMLAEDYKDKTRQEDILQKSDVDWTVVRPGFLNDGLAKADYRIIQDMEGFTSGDISRQDVAHLLLAIAEQNIYSRKIVFVSN